MPNVLLKNHSDELYFLWNPFWSEDNPLNPEDSLMSSTLVQMWTNFARQGKMYFMKILILSTKKTELGIQRQKIRLYLGTQFDQTNQNT